VDAFNIPEDMVVAKVFAVHVKVDVNTVAVVVATMLEIKFESWIIINRNRHPEPLGHCYIPPIQNIT